jgi:ABC-type branched-subunit amino acid transport system substrate-binding protein
MPLRSVLFSLALLASAATPAAQAQAVPRVADAELIFDQGVEAFEARDYGMAARRFRLVYAQFPLNQKTTAATLMAAKALRRSGETARADALLTDLVASYPTSRYAAEARRMLGETPSAPAQRERVTLGVALPLRGDAGPLTQALFNGLRAAVDEHNAGSQGPLIEMAFRDTRNEPGAAREAVGALAGAAVVVGPLFSDEARAAAQEADRRGLTLVAPLATDSDVSAGRSGVFQANPTLEMRGRAAARLALGDLRARQVGIVTAPGTSEEMAQAFSDEVMREGGQVIFYTVLPSSRDWGSLGERIDPTLLAQTDALYLPVAGGDAGQQVAAAVGALGSLDRVPTVIGNAEWHNRATAASARLGVVYTNDFVLDASSAEARRFLQAFESRYGSDLQRVPFVEQRLAATGYSLGRYLIDAISAGQPVDRYLRSTPRDAVGVGFDFTQGSVNRALLTCRYPNGRAPSVCTP